MVTGNWVNSNDQIQQIWKNGRVFDSEYPSYSASAFYILARRLQDIFPLTWKTLREFSRIWENYLADVIALWPIGMGVLWHFQVTSRNQRLYMPGSVFLYDLCETKSSIQESFSRIIIQVCAINTKANPLSYHTETM